MGIVRSAPAGARVQPGDRVAAFCMLGGFAEVTVAPEFLTFALPDTLDFAQGAGSHPQLPHRLLRARAARPSAGGRDGADPWRRRGRRHRRDSGRQRTGARTLAVVSSDEKAAVAREAGADEVLRADGAWKDEAKELTGGGVDVVIDPVGGERFTDSLRSLREEGRLVVVGFTGGSIPEVKVNRPPLNNIEVVGAGWGAYALGYPERNRRIGRAVNELIDGGYVRPIVGRSYPLERAGEALLALDRRQATGKIVLNLR